MSDRLSKQMAFIIEVDKLKSVLRQSCTIAERRRENDAEHSWHLALMAILLQEHANSKVDLLRVVKMLLIHDIVEIDAGDTFAYDETAHIDKAEREEKAFARIFSLLPQEMYDELYPLWQEFEQRESGEAKFAAALDRLQPLLLNVHTEGSAWQRHGVKKSQVLQRNRTIEEGSNQLWNYAQHIIEYAVHNRYLDE